VSFTPPNDIANVETAGATTLTFVGSHLAAFDEMVEKRNLDFESISKRLGFDSGIVSEDGSNVLLSVYESDALFWMVSHPCVFPSENEYCVYIAAGFGVGRQVVVLFECGQDTYSKRYADLNYRIDLPDEDVRSILGSDRWDHKFEMLLRYDQVRLWGPLTPVSLRLSIHCYRIPSAKERYADRKSLRSLL
jgi:phosphatidylinositol-bisphosphatase